ncbi:hypothetical protein NA57DRAFT_70888 [Rhizodiscina lignyota]|uniref:Cenp-O kinetochore centromere component n=1 Tax=Rhizodiscina lignyota TaxID=1504668 RepID=A0A9P4MBS2_9PEZI|nr:hypothetical protein NA57DRAFT_70888 [Rhizodiscina lignyota]
MDVLEDAPTTPLDREIASIRAEIAALRHRRSLLSTTLLSDHRVRDRIQRAKTNRSRRAISSEALERVADLAEKQERRNVENAYRIGAGVTSFKVQDPDPHAVDGGRVLGIRIEVFDAQTKSFGTPYYVFLNRPYGAEGAMRVHKHTVPPHIGIKNVVHKYLPQEGKQDLGRFARMLRRELVAHQKRVDSIEGLKVEAELPEAGLESIKATDISAREMVITWNDGCTGRVKIGKDGSIDGVTVREEGANTQKVAGTRRRGRERAIAGGDGRIEGVIRRLLKEGGW